MSKLLQKVAEEEAAENVNLDVLRKLIEEV